MASNGDGNGTKIGPGTWINLGLLIMALGGAVSVTWFMAGFKSSFDTANTTLASVDKRLENVEKGVDVLQNVTSDIVSGTEFRLWTAELKIRNPAIDVPTPALAHDRR